MQLELVTIPAGAFAMGRADGQPDERPVHEVWLDEVALGIHPVTNREYRRFVEATGRHPPAMFGNPRFELPEQPVVAVTCVNNYHPDLKREHHGKDHLRSVR